LWADCDIYDRCPILWDPPGPYLVPVGGGVRVHGHSNLCNLEIKDTHTSLQAAACVCPHMWRNWIYFVCVWRRVARQVDPQLFFFLFNDFNDFNDICLFSLF
jgi:hypothetical protein